MKRYIPAVRDVAGLSGAAMIAYGAWMIYEPAGFIIGGLMMVAAAIITAQVK